MKRDFSNWLSSFRDSIATYSYYVDFQKVYGNVADIKVELNILNHEITKKWGVDLSAISNQGKMEKRFDFVVKTESQIYVIETNFYGGCGSKLNETARSYKTLAQEVATIDGVTFVWFTDGNGWRSARHNLEETFDVMEHIYCIADMETDIMGKIFK